MKTVIIKVNNDSQTIAEYQVMPIQNQPTQPIVIQAASEANYELYDIAVGRAPDHLLTKRVGDDLHLVFQTDGAESDVIVEGFYQYERSALIGASEDNQFYYYVPDTGEIASYVTELVSGVTEGQALGGRPKSDAWWTEQPTVIDQPAGGIDALPWLVGLAGLMGVGILTTLIIDRNDDDNSASDNVEVIPEEVTTEQTNEQTSQQTTEEVAGNSVDTMANIASSPSSVNDAQVADAIDATVKNYSSEFEVKIPQNAISINNSNAIHSFIIDNALSTAQVDSTSHLIETLNNTDLVDVTLTANTITLSDVISCSNLDHDLDHNLDHNNLLARSEDMLQVIDSMSALTSTGSNTVNFDYNNSYESVESSNAIIHYINHDIIQVTI